MAELLTQPSFDISSGWSFNPSSPVLATGDYDAIVKHSGAQSYHIDKTTAGASWTKDVFIYQYVTDVNVGKQYNMSAWIKPGTITSVDKGLIGVRIFFYDSTNVVLNIAKSEAIYCHDNPDQTAADWIQISGVSDIAPTGTVKALFEVRACGDFIGDFWIDDCSMTEYVAPSLQTRLTYPEFKNTWYADKHTNHIVLNCFCDNTYEGFTLTDWEAVAVLKDPDAVTIATLTQATIPETGLFSFDFTELDLTKTGDWTITVSLALKADHTPLGNSDITTIKRATGNAGTRRIAIDTSNRTLINESPVFQIIGTYSGYPTEERLLEMKSYGFNTICAGSDAELPDDDTPLLKNFLDLCETNGMYCIAKATKFWYGYQLGKQTNIAGDTLHDSFQSLITAYASYDALLGYFMTDDLYDLHSAEFAVLSAIVRNTDANAIIYAPDNGYIRYDARYKYIDVAGHYSYPANREAYYGENDDYVWFNSRLSGANSAGLSKPNFPFIEAALWYYPTKPDLTINAQKLILELAIAIINGCRGIHIYNAYTGLYGTNAVATGTKDAVIAEVAAAVALSDFGVGNDTTGFSITGTGLISKVRTVDGVKQFLVANPTDTAVYATITTPAGVDLLSSDNLNGSSGFVGILNQSGTDNIEAYGVRLYITRDVYKPAIRTSDWMKF